MVWGGIQDFRICGFLQERALTPQPTSCIAGGQPSPQGSWGPGQTPGNVFSRGSPPISKGIAIPPNQCQIVYISHILFIGFAVLLGEIITILECI